MRPSHTGFWGLVLLLGVLLSVSVYFNVQAIQEQQAQRATIKKQDTQLTDTKKTLATIKEELSAEQKKREKELITRNNDNGYAKVYKAYQETTKEVFTTLYTFSPENFKERQEKAKVHLSADVFRQFFNANGKYGDSNNVSSELLELTTYNQAVQGTTLNGLVVLVFESNVAGADPLKNRAIYQVAYDTDTHQLTQLKLLTTGISGDLLD